MKFLLFFFFIFIKTVFASWQIPDKYLEMTSFDWKYEENLDEEKAVFLSAFKEAYKDYSEKDLAIYDKEAFLEETFFDLEKDYFLQKVQLIVAKKEGKVIGFIGFEPTENPGQLYINYMAIDPNYWGRGIGTELLFSVLTQFPNTKSLVLITRRINEVAKAFYSRLGFVETSYMHEGHNLEKYIGYELQLN